MYFFDPACQSGCVRCYSGFASINLYCEFFDEISLLTVENSFYHDYTKYTKSSGRIKAKMIVNLLTFANIMLHPFGKMYGSKISLF